MAMAHHKANLFLSHRATDDAARSLLSCRVWMGVGHLRGRVPHRLPHHRMAIALILSTRLASAYHHPSLASVVRLPPPARRWAVKARRALLCVLAAALMYRHPLLYAADAKSARMALPPLAHCISPLRGRPDIHRAARTALSRAHALSVAAHLRLRRRDDSATRHRRHGQLCALAAANAWHAKKNRCRATLRTDKRRLRFASNGSRRMDQLDWYAALHRTFGR